MFQYSLPWKMLVLKKNPATMAAILMCVTLFLLLFNPKEIKFPPSKLQEVKLIAAFLHKGVIFYSNIIMLIWEVNKCCTVYNMYLKFVTRLCSLVAQGNNS